MIAFTAFCALLVLAYLLAAVWDSWRRVRRRDILLAPSERCERYAERQWRVGGSMSGWKS